MDPIEYEIKRRTEDLSSPIERLRALAALSGTNRDQLARAAGLPYWKTQRILRGAVAPSPDELRRLAEALGARLECGQ